VDDIRVGSVFPYDKYRDQESPDLPKRKRHKNQENQPTEQDDVVVLSEQSEATADAPGDYYAPGGETEEPK
jgi:hypothetical protein